MEGHGGNFGDGAGVEELVCIYEDMGLSRMLVYMVTMTVMGLIRTSRCI